MKVKWHSGICRFQRTGRVMCADIKFAEHLIQKYKGCTSNQVKILKRQVISPQPTQFFLNFVGPWLYQKFIQLNAFSSY